MFDPSEMQVDEAWIAFRLNDAPICTEADGDFNVLALMDVASCYMLGTEFVPVDSKEPSVLESKRLLKGSYLKHQRWPRTLYISSNVMAATLCAEAESHGIAVIHTPEEQLLVCIGEAQEGFKEHVSRGSDQ